MIKRNIKAIAFASLTAAILLTAFSASLAQSGGASLHGWVAFEDVAYVDKQPRAKVVLQHDPPGSGPAYSTETDEHGFFEFPHQPWQIQVRDHGQRVSTLFRRCLYAVGFRRQLGRAAQGGSTEATVIKQRLSVREFVDHHGSKPML
jgi:hypothetical protein